MANEVSVSIRVKVRSSNGNLNYSTPNVTTQEDLGSDKGPTPGYLSITTAGENVLFDELVTPGRVVIQNIDEDNYVEYGIHDGSIFHPIGEVLPGGKETFRFSRNLGEEADVSPGTGTTGNVNEFFLKANTATCGVIVDAFEA